MPRVSRNWWRLVLVGALGILPLAPPAGAVSNDAPILDAQDASVHLGADGATWSLRLGQVHNGDQLSITLYRPVHALSDIMSVASGSFSGSVLAHVASLPANCAGGYLAVHLSALDTSAAPRCDHVLHVALSLRCAGDTCNGVYPVQLVTRRAHQRLSLWTTVVVSATSATSLSVAWVITSTPTAASDIDAAIRSLRGIESSAPYSVALSDASLVNALAQQRASAYGAAIMGATSGHSHSLVQIAPTNVDVANLVAHELHGDADEQLTFFSRVARTVGISRAVSPPLFFSDVPHLGELSWLAARGYRDVVLPDNSLTASTEATQSQGAPFSVSLGGQSLALAAPSTSATLASLALEPARRAAITLAALSFVHFEHPYWPVSPTIVAATPTSAGAAYLHDLATQLAASPLIHLISLAHAFDATAPGANGLPLTRSTQWRASQDFTDDQYGQLRALAAADHALRSCVGERNAPLTLTFTRLVAERVVIGRAGWLTLSQQILNRHLDNTRVDESPITLTARTSTIPITIINNTPGTSYVVVRIHGEHLEVHAPLSRTISLTQPTTVLHLPVSISRGSVGDVTVFVLSRDQHLILAHATIRVNYATVSTVGYALTFGALGIIVVWWIRNWRRASRGRHGQLS